MRFEAPAGCVQYRAKGDQFTCEAFTDVLKRPRQLRSAWMARARWVGQRVRRTSVCGSVKYEDVYLRAYEVRPPSYRAGLARYFGFYNTRRRHSALDRHHPRCGVLRPGSPRIGSLRTRGRFHLPHCLKFPGSISPLPSHTTLGDTQTYKQLLAPWGGACPESIVEYIDEDGYPTDPP